LIEKFGEVWLFWDEGSLNLLFFFFLFFFLIFFSSFMWAVVRPEQARRVITDRHVEPFFGYYAHHRREGMERAAHVFMGQVFHDENKKKNTPSYFSSLADIIKGGKRA
jgi:hypothetical protein